MTEPTGTEVTGVRKIFSATGDHVGTLSRKHSLRVGISFAYSPEVGIGIFEGVIRPGRQRANMRLVFDPVDPTKIVPVNYATVHDLPDIKLIDAAFIDLKVAPDFSGDLSPSAYSTIMRSGDPQRIVGVMKSLHAQKSNGQTDHQQWLDKCLDYFSGIVIEYVYRHKRPIPPDLRQGHGYAKQWIELCMEGKFARQLQGGQIDHRDFIKFIQIPPSNGVAIDTAAAPATATSQATPTLSLPQREITGPQAAVSRPLLVPPVTAVKSAEVVPTASLSGPASSAKAAINGALNREPPLLGYKKGARFMLLNQDWDFGTEKHIPPEWLKYANRPATDVG